MHVWMYLSRGRGVKAIVLLSGGLDSSTCLALALRDGFDVHALSFRYGQRHTAELDAASKIAKHFGVSKHVIADIDLRMFGGSALTADIEVPKNRTEEAIGTGIPVTYVPARNTVFLAFALSWADAIDAGDIFIGVNALDYSGYPDCRPEFIEAFQSVARLGTTRGAEGNPSTIQTPLIRMSKAEIVRTGLSLDVPFGITRTCYDPSGGDGAACGICDACVLRIKGFAENGQSDPAPYCSGAKA